MFFNVSNFNTTGEVLQDLKQSGKERDWKGKKVKSLSVSASYKRLKFYARSKRVEECGSVLIFRECKADGYKKLIKANFCKDRLCPLCNWRRSLMLHSQILKILHVASERQKIRYLFLTLTVENCKPEDLSKTIDSMFEGFRRLFQYKQVDKNMIGWVRTLEITYNKKKNTYHPHFHVLIGVTPSYFDSGYIKQADWTDYWKKALKVAYTPVVNIKIVKPKREGQTVEAATAETAKYTVKDSDYIFDKEKDTDKVIKVLASVLKGRRLIGFGKLFADIKKELKLADVETSDSDLVGADEGVCACPLCGSDLQETIYQWHIGYNDYLKVE